MAYNDVFDFANSTSEEGTGAGKKIFGYIPKDPNEVISVGPHDPYGEIVDNQQDPKLVRETSPQAAIISNFIGALTSDIKSSSENVGKAISDPSSVVNPGAGVMASAKKTTDKVKDDIPTPSESTVPSGKAKDEKPDNWDAKAKAEVQENKYNKKK